MIAQVEVSIKEKKALKYGKIYEDEDEILSDEEEDLNSH